MSNTPSACLFGLQLNEKQLELVRFEKQLELDGLWNVKLLFGNPLLEQLVDMRLVVIVGITPVW
jgi:hypothetical protein